MSSLQAVPASNPERDSVLEQVRGCVVRYVAGRNPEWADDIAQEVMLLIHVRYPHLEKTHDLLPLGITIARLKIYEFQRRRTRGGAQFAEEFDAVDSNSPSVEEQLIRKSAAERLRHGIRQLGVGCQQLLQMFLEGKKTDEMRGILGLTDSAYYTRLCRCRQRLSLIMGWSA